jgi:hypothetical protein
LPYKVDFITLVRPAPPQDQSRVGKILRKELRAMELAKGKK